ncbi:MAG: SUMF1/EgtB/PvdO family nonheme iron enzyme [Pseudomonadota bacterium]
MPRRSFSSSAIMSLSAVGVLAVFVAVNPADALQDQRPPDFTQLDAAPFMVENAPHSAQAQETMLGVPAGTYTLGRDGGPRAEQPAHSVDVAAFRIDRTEVTNAAFAEYLNALNLPVAEPFEAGAASLSVLATDQAALLMEGRRGSDVYPIIALDDNEARIGVADGAFRPTSGFEEHPVAETTWAGARAYCAWRGARLPSEAEWEAAARGADARLYPWGDAAPDETRVFVSGRTGVTETVGTRPGGASPVGALDMSGSLAEWTSTLRRPYPYDPNDGREAPNQPGERVTRGGDYIFDAEPATLTATHRAGFSNAPERGHRHIGFRCVAGAA